MIAETHTDYHKCLWRQKYNWMNGVDLFFFFNRMLTSLPTILRLACRISEVQHSRENNKILGKSGCTWHTEAINEEVYLFWLEHLLESLLFLFFAASGAVNNQVASIWTVTRADIIIAGTLLWRWEVLTQSKRAKKGKMISKTFPQTFPRSSFVDVFA